MKELRFNYVYHSASIIANRIELYVPFQITIKKTIKSIRQKAIEFKKETLLHVYIKEELKSYYDMFFLEDPEYLPNEGVLELEILQRQFEEYRIPLKFLEIKYDDYDYPITSKSQIQTWYKKNRLAFFQLIEILHNEIFFILFANRKILHRFNEIIANNFNHFKFPKKHLTKKGTLKRKTIPIWVKNAVKHREKGRCAICGDKLAVTLSNENENDNRKNFDHIIPLDLFGVNDPTNIQLLCESHNLKKLNKNTSVGEKYETWF